MQNRDAMELSPKRRHQPTTLGLGEAATHPSPTAAVGPSFAFCPPTAATCPLVKVVNSCHTLQPGTRIRISTLLYYGVSRLHTIFSAALYADRPRHSVRELPSIE